MRKILIILVVSIFILSFIVIYGIMRPYWIYIVDLESRNVELTENEKETLSNFLKLKRDIEFTKLAYMEPDTSGESVIYIFFKTKVKRNFSNIGQGKFYLLEDNNEFYEYVYKYDTYVRYDEEYSIICEIIDKYYKKYGKREKSTDIDMETGRKKEE